VKKTEPQLRALKITYLTEDCAHYELTFMNGVTVAFVVSPIDKTELRKLQLMVIPE
jgi:hypothetical protein